MSDDPNADSAADLATAIYGLWDDEGCEWKLHCDAPYVPGQRWALLLTFRTEPWHTDMWTGSGPPFGGADWMTLDWLFYGDTPEEAMTDGLKWLRALAKTAQKEAS